MPVRPRPSHLAQEMSQLGGRNCAHDALAALDALCSVKEGEMGSLACAQVVRWGGIKVC